MKGAKTVILFLLAGALITTLATPVSDCPTGCRCRDLSLGSSHDAWRQLQSSLRLHRFMVGTGRSLHADQTEAHQKRIEMTCIGIRQPSLTIPSGIERVKIYGDFALGVPMSQRDEPERGHRDWETWAHNLGVAPPNEEEDGDNIARITQIPEPQTDEIKELFIEGNFLQRLGTGAFRSYTSVQTLSLKKNNIKVIAPGALNGLVNVKEVDLSRNSLVFLSELSTQRLPNLETLILTDNLIEEISGNHFHLLPKLLELDLSDNNIRFLDSDTFSSLPLLETLNLAFNELSYLPSYLLLKNNKVKWISIEGNSIGLIETSTFSHLTELEYLNLAKNRVTNIDALYFENVFMLQTLILSHNQISTIDYGAFQQLSNLTHLDLSSNQIHELDRRMVSGLTDVEKLDLSNNRISSISNEILSEMLSLKSLYLTANRILSITAGTFYGMANLVEVRLDKNEINHVDDKAFSITNSRLKNLSKLGWLFLDNNQIRMLTRGTLSGLPYLRYLGLSRNDITRVDKDAFRHLANLIALNLEENRIDELADGLFQSQTAMKSLKVGGNGLTRITPSMLRGLGDLEDLYVQENFITDIEDDSFRSLVSLRLINLSMNQLAWFDMNMLLADSRFSRIKMVDLSKNKLMELIPTAGVSLKQLNIADNYLTTLEEDVTLMLVKGGHLHAYGNPLRCDCQTAWMPTVFTKRPYLFVRDREVMCKSPLIHAGRQVFGLSQHELCSRFNPIHLITNPLTTTSTTSTTTPKTTPTTTPTTTSTTMPATLPPISKSSSQWIATTQPFIYEAPYSYLFCDKQRSNNFTLRGKRLFVSKHAHLTSLQSIADRCIGARLNTEWAVFQASCLNQIDSLSNYTVRFGSPRHSKHAEVIRAFKHPEYRKPYRLHDIALVQLKANRLHIADDTCILSRSDLEASLDMFGRGVLTSIKSNSTNVSLRRAKLKSQLCSNGIYLCSRLKNTPDNEYSLIGAPLYLRYGIGDVDWGLAALNTDIKRFSKSGRSIMRKQLPLYAYVNWFDYIMSQYTKVRAL